MPQWTLGGEGPPRKEIPTQGTAEADSPPPRPSKMGGISVKQQARLVVQEAASSYRWTPPISEPSPRSCAARASNTDTHLCFVRPVAQGLAPGPDQLIHGSMLVLASRRADASEPASPV